MKFASFIPLFPKMYFGLFPSFSPLISHFSFFSPFYPYFGWFPPGWEPLYPLIFHLFNSLLFPIFPFIFDICSPFLFPLKSHILAGTMVLPWTGASFPPFHLNFPSFIYPPFPPFSFPYKSHILAATPQSGSLFSPVTLAEFLLIYPPAPCQRQMFFFQNLIRIWKGSLPVIFFSHKV